MPNQRLANHILPNAATMIGVCVTAVGLVKIAEPHIGPSRVDTYCALAALIFLASAMCSYMALRFEGRERMSASLERIADACFMAGLLALTVVTMLFAYEVI
ncbi:MAG: hypothetical protein JOZ72_09480 [Alphaproteobacteria bacterium]|nr:hypothetical protein [Alphaproteobacteria bacterium]